MNNPEIPKKSISIRQFPPKLRKLAKYISKSQQKKSISQYCEDLHLRTNSIYSMIAEQKAKGNDFYELIAEYSLDSMRSKLLQVDDTVTNMAISGSERHSNLYYKRLGLLKDFPLVNIDNRSITVIASPTNVPQSVIQRLPTEDVSEVEIEGPKKK